MRLARCFVASFLILSASSQASATELIIEDASMHERQQTIAAMAILGVFGTHSHFGLSGWYGFPILPDGFIPTLNDAFYIEGGAAIERYAYDFLGCEFSWYRLSPMAGARWDFNLTEDWTVYGRGLAGFGIGFGNEADCFGLPSSASPKVSGVQFLFGLGANWQFHPAWALRVELGNWIMAGVSTKI